AIFSVDAGFSSEQMRSDCIRLPGILVMNWSETVGSAGSRAHLRTKRVTSALCSGGHDLRSHRHLAHERIADGRTRLCSLNDRVQLVVGGIGCGYLDADPHCTRAGMNGAVDSEDAAEVGFAVDGDL